MCYKLGPACVKNWGSFVLLQIRENVVTNCSSFVIANRGKCCYKLGQVLQIRAIITNWGIALATFHLHCLGHRVKYGNPEVGNTTQQILSTTRPCCSIKFIESFLFWVILVTYNIGIYICIYIYKVSYIHSFFIFNCNVFSTLHVKNFEISSWFLHRTVHQMMWYFWMFILNPFYLLCNIFFLKKTVCGLLVSCLSLY